MAILYEANYRIIGPVYKKLYRDNALGNRMVREEGEFTVQWNCDDSGGETTHEATFATMFDGGGWELVSYGPNVPWGRLVGTYSETYHKELSPWTMVDASSSTP
jgi:hypothetical protein